MPRSDAVTGPPPDFDPSTMKLDFSQFHALDHFPGSSYCRTQYGSWRQHLKNGWDFKWSDDVQRPFRRLLCKIGKHDVRVFYNRRPVGGWEEGACCWWCGGERS
jgi:hypothetical protein